MEVISVCKMCSVNILSVIRTHKGASRNLGGTSHRPLVPFSPSSFSSAGTHCQFLYQPVCSMLVGFYPMGVLSTQRKLVRPSTNNFGLVGEKSDVRYSLDPTALLKSVRLPLRRELSRLQCKAEARLSDSRVGISEGEDVSAKSENASSNSAETRESNSAHVSTGIVSQRGLPVNLATGVGVTAAVFFMVLLGFLVKPRGNGGGSMADLIRRGQVRSDRGADSEVLKYEDPFSNPLVKMGTKNPVVRMCGKMFRLAPVTLTDEKVAKHQNRRIQAYKWKRPIVFLNEGDPVPDGVDPEEVRWIPSNHPFATTSNYIDEDLAQKNVYQTRGVPSRLRAEHEALRRKMEETTKREQDFQPPGLQLSAEQAWKTSTYPVEETSEGNDRNLDRGGATDSPTSSDKQINGKGGGSSSSLNAQSQGGGNFSGEAGSRLRNIDFSGEVHGSGGRDQQRFNKGLDN